MQSSGDDKDAPRASVFVPVELEERGLLVNPAFRELNRRALARADRGIRLVEPWIRWQGFSAQLDCIAYADRSARALPAGRAMNLSHVTPGRLYTVSAVFLAHALIANIAGWLCDALPLDVDERERRFDSARFQETLRGKAVKAGEALTRHEQFVREIERYYDVWVHARAEAAMETLGVPLDPGHEEAVYKVGQFTGKVFEGSAAFFMTWLRFALQHVR